MERKVLGKGLEALIPKQPTAQMKRELVSMPVSKIVFGKYQPRQKMEAKELQELSQSIREKGLIQPIVVRKSHEGMYEIVAGARRFSAAKSLGINEIPTLIKDLSDKDAFMLAIAENLQRTDLNPIEEAAAFKRLMQEFELTLEEVGKFLGKDKSSVANTLRLLKLPDDIQHALRQNIITRTQARTILGLPTEQEQRKMLHDILQGGLSVREIERRVRKQSTRKKRKAHDPFVGDLEERIARSLGTKVKVLNKRNNKGKIVIEYYTLEDLERITKRIV